VTRADVERHKITTQHKTHSYTRQPLAGFSVDVAPVNSNIWKSRYQPNVQLRMLYLANETGPLKLFKWPSYISLNATFSSFSIPPPHLEPEMEMTQAEFFYQIGVPYYWMDGAYFGPNRNILI
jgi:hypothetical protein